MLKTIYTSKEIISLEKAERPKNPRDINDFTKFAFFDEMHSESEIEPIKLTAKMTPEEILKKVYSRNRVLIFRFIYKFTDEEGNYTFFASENIKELEERLELIGASFIIYNEETKLYTLERLEVFLKKHLKEYVNYLNQEVFTIKIKNRNDEKEIQSLDLYDYDESINWICNYMKNEERL